MAAFGRILRDLREKRDMTQEQLAKKSGIHRVQITKMETGKAKCPSWKAVQKLAEALGVDCTAFVEN